jgi:hypothetical protein
MPKLPFNLKMLTDFHSLSVKHGTYINFLIHYA